MMMNYSNYRKRKRGFVGDILTVMVLLFLVAIFIMVGKMILDKYNTQLQSMTWKEGDIGPGIVSKANDDYVGLWDGIFAFFLIGFSLAAVIGAFMLDTHPIFFIFSIILLAFYIIVSAVISNAYYAIESDIAFSATAESFVVMHYVMNHLPYYIAIEGFLILLALYAKPNM